MWEVLTPTKACSLFGQRGDLEKNKYDNFHFLTSGSPVCIEEIFVMPTTFLSFTCLTGPLYNYKERRMTVVYNAGEILSASRLPSYKIARPVFLKHNFVILILAQNFLRSPLISYLKSTLSNLPPVIPFKEHANNAAKLVHFGNFSHPATPAYHDFDPNSNHLSRLSSIPLSFTRPLPVLVTHTLALSECPQQLLSELLFLLAFNKILPCTLALFYDPPSTPVVGK